MKILIVTTRFFPFGSATSTVVGNLAEALVGEQCEVHIAALTRYFENAGDSEWHENISVHQSYAPSMITKEQVKIEYRKHCLRTIHGLSQKVLDKSVQRIMPKYRKYSLSHSLVSKYRKAIRAELNGKYDLVMVTLAPIEAVWAVSEIDFGNAMFAIYQVDPYWNNADFPDVYAQSRFALESSLVKKSDFCITTPLIALQNIRLCPELKEKYVIAEFPCLKESEEKGDNIADGKIHCAFLGTLNPKLRPPEKLVEIIGAFDTSGIVFDFYGSGQYLIREASGYPMARNRIRLHGTVSSAAAEVARLSSDILINIDNTSLSLVPSKIFEYMSTGKPIINCYFLEDSYTLKYLRKYPLCLNVNLNEELTVNKNKLEMFVNNCKEERLPFGLIRELFTENTPEYVAKQCLDKYNSCKNIKNAHSMQTG